MLTKVKPPAPKKIADRAIAVLEDHKAIDIRCLDGTTRTILSSISPLRGLKGEIVGAVILIQDLTETRKIEEDLEERVNRLIGLGVELEQSVSR